MHNCFRRKNNQK